MNTELNRRHVVTFRITDNEKALIKKRFQSTKHKRMSDYLRRQAICGAVISVDDSHFDYIKKQLAGACNNINQIAFQANKTRGVSLQMIDELQRTRKVLEDIFESVEQLKETVGLDIESKVLEDAYQKLFERLKEQKPELWQ